MTARSPLMAVTLMLPASGDWIGSSRFVTLIRSMTSSATLKSRTQGRFRLRLLVPVGQPFVGCEYDAIGARTQSDL